MSVVKMSIVFLRNIFTKIYFFIGIMLVLLGGMGLFLQGRSAEVLYLIISVVGYAVLASASYLEILNMNKKENISSHHLR